MMSLCISRHILDDIEKVGHGQIELEKLQSSISQQLFKIQTYGHLWLNRQMMPLCITCYTINALEKPGQGHIDLDS